MPRKFGSTLNLQTQLVSTAALRRYCLAVKPVKWSFSGYKPLLHHTTRPKHTMCGMNITKMLVCKFGMSLVLLHKLGWTGNVQAGSVSRCEHVVSLNKHSADVASEILTDIIAQTREHDEFGLPYDI